MSKRKYNKFKCLLIGVVLVLMSRSIYAKMDTKDEDIYLEVPKICQYPLLPTGCESVAAAMVLQYYGEDVKAEVFASEWLKKDSNFYNENGVLYGPDPYEVFVGDPFSRNSYGCFAQVIAEAINQNSDLCKAETIYDISLQELCDTYLSHGQPVLIWATMGMKEASDGNSWTLPDGNSYTWIAGEHCLVLTGYDSRHYYLNDPMSGATVGYSKEIVEKRYESLGKQAVIISLKEV